MNKNKKTIIGAGAAAVLATLAITLFGNVNTVDLQGKYQITEKNEYTSELQVEIPDEFSADIYELQLNDGEINKALLPNGTITTLPIVTSDVDNLSILFYHRGEQAGVGKFTADNTLLIKAKEEFTNDTTQK